MRLIVQVGAPREIRTPDPLVRSQVLYPAELWALNLCRLKRLRYVLYLLVRPERFELPTP
jgi:hypothetical protein